jgi:hypothetical protein
VEDKKAIMARFLNGLNHDMVNIMELEGIMHITTKMKRHSSVKVANDLTNHWVFHHLGNLIRRLVWGLPNLN